MKSKDWTLVYSYTHSHTTTQKQQRSVFFFLCVDFLAQLKKIIFFYFLNVFF